LSDPTLTPMVAAVWYPPGNWRPGEIVVTETLPQLLPDTFHLGIAVGPDGSFSDSTRRYPLDTTNTASRIYAGRWAQLATFKHQGPLLTHLAPRPTLQPLTPVDAHFGPSIRLAGYRLEPAVSSPDATVSLLLTWQADRPLSTDYTVFVHLLAAGGTRLAQHDAYPTWLTPQPTSQWPAGQSILDSHLLHLPADAPPGLYTVQVGLYNAQTMVRLPLADGRDALPLTQIEIK
jgi:hypothetical protein